MSAQTFLDGLKRCKTRKAANSVIGKLRSRIAEIELVGWPLLEQVLRAELAACEALLSERTWL